MKRSTLALAVLLVAPPAGADPASAPPTWDQALGEAKAKGKPLVLEFWASW